MNHLILLVALPLIAAFLQPQVSRASTLAGRTLGPVVLAAMALIGLQAWGGLGDGAVSLYLGGFAPPFGITFYVDRMAALFAIAVALGTLALWPYGAEGERVREYTLTLVLAAAASGLALSGDLFNLYVFYELTAVASYGLVAARRRPAGLAATMRYVILSSFGAALALLGIALIYQQAGTLNLAQLAQLAPERLAGPVDLAAFVLILIGFGVKAELFPVNSWVPEVYATASKRVSALLAGVVSKLALLVVVRLLVLVFHEPRALEIMLVLGVLGVVTGELAAWRATDLTRMLAYSSIGQLGMIFIAFSIPGEAGLFAGLSLALHHMVVKPALFLLAERWGGSLERLAGAARSSPLGAIVFIVLALSLIGVPPLPGFWAKLLVMIHLMEQGQALYLAGGAVIMAGAVLEANYLFRIAVSFYRPAPAGEVLPPAHGLRDLGTASVLGAALLAGAFLMTPLGTGLQDIAAQAADVQHYIATVHPAPAP